MPDLQRIAIWGVAAASALTIAAFAGTSTAGIDRLKQAAGQLQEVIWPAGGKPLRPLDAREGQRLAESVRRLIGDRERLAERIGAVEHSVESITGSVARIGKAAEAATKAAEAIVAERSAPALPAIAAESPPAEESTSSVNAAAGIQAAAPHPSQAAPASEPPGKSEFGLDIGAGATIDALRALWAKSRQQHAIALDGLRPIVQVREGRRAGAVDLRLIAGPLPSAVAAARLCAKLTAAGAACQPAVFDGQRLTAR